ncbi:MAG: hypothetical protein OEY36_12145 [Gammaproteobacteria bacterium]|nr:hypothetical protein [Gammaproteobacteria bacterium]
MSDEDNFDDDNELDDQYDDYESVDDSRVARMKNYSARRRLEALREDRELERSLNSVFNESYDSYESHDSYLSNH